MQRSNADLQYHSSSEVTAPSFYPAFSVTRVGESTTSSAGVDSYVCRFGRNTGKTCDNIRSLQTCRDVYGGLVAMDERLAGGGDSGGPWYLITKGYGVHSGWYSAGGAWRDQ